MGGPNHGYYYVSHQDSRMNRQYRINERLTFGSKSLDLPWILSNGDTLWVNHWTYLDSAGWDPGDLRDGTLAHETYGQNGAKGHQGQIEKALTTSACGDGPALVDRIVAPSQASVDQLVKQVKAYAIMAFNVGSATHHYVHSNHDFTRSAIVRYQTSPTDTLFIHGHRDLQGAKPNYPTNRCDWTIF